MLLSTLPLLSEPETNTPANTYFLGKWYLQNSFFYFRLDLDLRYRTSIRLQVEILKNLVSNPSFMTIKRLLTYLLLILATWFVGHLVYSTLDGLTDDKKKADLAVILGNKVNSDGTLSERLTQRLACGLALYREGRVHQILVSGGFGKEGFYEGTKMKDYLVKNNVPDSCIIVDNKGNNTLATVENTLRLKDSLNFKSIIVVSQYFHLTRTKMLFKKLHFENVSGVSPKYFEIRDLYAITREFFAYYTE